MQVEFQSWLHFLSLNLKSNELFVSAFQLLQGSEAVKQTFPGIKQQRLESTYFMKVMLSKESRVSTAARMSAWRASEWFLLSDSRLQHKDGDNYDRKEKIII